MRFRGLPSDRAIVVGVAMAFAMLAHVVPAGATTAPIKPVLSRHIGFEVDTTNKNSTTCVVASGDCKRAMPSGTPGGFEYPESVAGAATGSDIYVADRGNNRVQELTSTGEFVMMFGKEVNKTTGANVCTKASGNTCGAGVSGGTAEAFEAQSITVDPVTGTIYIADIFDARLDEYTSSGQFILMVGKDVNKKGGNLCTAAETAECKAGVRSSPGGTEKGAFAFHQGVGDLLAVSTGGSEDLVYVADDQRVQEFNEKGEWKSEIATGNGEVSALAIDNATATTYAVTEGQPTLRAFNAEGKEEASKNITVQPREEGQQIYIAALVADQAGRLALSAFEGSGFVIKQFGSLYEASTKRVLAEFQTPPFQGTETEGPVDINSLGFNSQDELFAVLPGVHELRSYEPEPVAELASSTAVCSPGPEHASDVTFSCSLAGDVDPWGVSQTEVWFQWGRTETLGNETLARPIKTQKEPPIEGEEEPFVPVSAVIEGVRPNETNFYYRLVGRDKNVSLSEPLLGSFPIASFASPAVAPKLLGLPLASFVTATSAVLFGEINPENSVTHYLFEYGPVAALEECPSGSLRTSCAGVLTTKSLESAQYGKVAGTFEASSLQPSTTYGFRMAAAGPAGENIGQVSSFTTAGASQVQAQVGSAGAVGATSAIVSGSVNPAGQPATYSFELAIYNGAQTQYGVVSSGPVTGIEPVPESLPLSGLQPATTYAYRISVRYGDGSIAGSSAASPPALFTTEGLAVVLPSPSPLAMLATPDIAFPKESVQATPKKLTRAQQLARAFKACGKRVKSKRAFCERKARRKFGANSTK